MEKNTNKKYAVIDGGFTLVEIIVSLAVFIVVAVIAVGAFLKILDANKQAQSLETAMNNANFALDSMTRDLRVGYGYDCYDSGAGGTYTTSPEKTSCPIGNTYVYPAIAFYSSQAPEGWSCANPPVHIYRYDPTPLDGSPGRIEKGKQDVCNGGITFVPLTAPTFKIQSFGLSVDTGDKMQSKAFIYMRATAGSNVQNQTVFTVQTTVSQHLMNGL